MTMVGWRVYPGWWEGPYTQGGGRAHIPRVVYRLPTYPGWCIGSLYTQGVRGAHIPQGVVGVPIYLRVVYALHIPQGGVCPAHTSGCGMAQYLRVWYGPVPQGVDHSGYPIVVDHSGYPIVVIPVIPVLKLTPEESDGTASYLRIRAF